MKSLPGVKRSLSFLATLAAAYLGLCLLAFVFQSKLVYIPGGPPQTTPGDLGIEYEDLFLETADGVRIHAWWIPASDSIGSVESIGPTGSIGALVFCHGNAGNIAHRIQSAETFRAMGLSVMLFDYRGYGRSEGSPDEKGTYLDAEAAWEHVTGAAGVEPERVVVYGESLGAGVAIELAQRRRVGAVITESAFTSAADVGAAVYPWLPVRLLLRIGYENRAKIGALSVPVLVIHSPEDEIVPFEHGRELHEAAPEPKAFLETGGRHNDGGFLQDPAWRRAVGEFVRGALEG
ncbi:MAG: alpha/beta hydrolase [Planctomycetota bacterium]|nr:alpha/beta hydrolase [Planctomycetota bacterium]